MWTLDSTRIFVSDWKESENQIIPRLQPLDGGTTLQIFGYENPITHITGLVVGLTDKNTLKGFTTDGVEHTLLGPYSISGSFLVKSVSATMIQSVCQTIRPDLDQDSPVYTVEIDFFE